MALVQYVRRQQSQNVRIAAGAGENIFRKQSRLYFLGGPRGLESQQKSRALHAGDRADDAAGTDVGGDLTHIGEQRLRFDGIDDRLGHRTSHRAAAESRAHVIDLQPAGDTARQHQRRYRKPISQGFRRGDDVGGDAEEFRGERRAGPSHSALHLAEYQYRTHLVSSLA